MATKISPLNLFIFKDVTWAFESKRRENQAGMGLRTQTGLGTAPLLLQCYVSSQDRYSSCTAVPQETMGKPNRNGFTNTNRAGYGSFSASMLRFFSWYSNCTAVPQETMGKPSRNGFTNTNRAGYGSLAAAMLRFFSWLSSCTAVPHETTGKKSRNGFTNKTSRNGRTAFSAVCHGPVNIQATSAVECDL